MAGWTAGREMFKRHYGMAMLMHVALDNKVVILMIGSDYIVQNV